MYEKNVKITKFMVERFSEQMERLDDDTLPVEGTIYYEDENMDTVYVAESMNQGDEEHYQYEGHPEEQEDQDWEEANEGNSENHEEEGPPQVKRIFHLFKNDEE